MVYCTNCARRVSGVRPYDGHLCCPLCGKVLEDSNFSDEPQFVKDSSGQSKLSGQSVRSVQQGGSESRQRTLDRVFNELGYMKSGLNIDDYSDSVVEMALKFYEIALEKNLTKGRRSELVQAACLYLACREMEKPFLLIDFAVYLNINVYEIGATYLQLLEKLHLLEYWGEKALALVDPSIFIPKFTNALLLERNDEVVQTAKDIITSMKRDWMQTGRKPSGLCGAALYISALSHGLKCSKSDIIKIMHVCEATLTKRLTEFENTESGSLTTEELREREKELRSNFSLTPLSKANSSMNEILCEHKDGKLFAYGLCERCYRKFMEVSGGLEGGSDPPAFQAAEKQRLLSEANVEEESHSPFDHGQEDLETIKISGDSNTEAAVADYSSDRKHDLDTEALEESSSFSDIDDTEVDGYLNNDEEVKFKKIIWEEMNREYEEEQAAKEAARKAVLAKYENCPEGLEAAKELAEAAAAAAAKSRKERQQKRAAEDINSPPQTAAEATRRMLTKKGLSSKINLDAVAKLFDEPGELEPVKKRRTESELDTGTGTTKIATEDHDIEESFEADNVQPKSGNVDQESYADDFNNLDGAYEYDEDLEYDAF